MFKPSSRQLFIGVPAVFANLHAHFNKFKSCLFTYAVHVLLYALCFK